jgi:hypothetical protein
MSQPLPTGFMQFLDDEEIQNFNMTDVPKDAEKGYVL